MSRSGTLTYQALYELKQKDIGVTTCVGIGGDPVPGTSFIDCLEAFEAGRDQGRHDDRRNRWSAEEEAAEFIKNHMSKPVSPYIAGVTAPPGKKMGRRRHRVGRRAPPQRRWKRWRMPASGLVRTQQRPAS